MNKVSVQAAQQQAAQQQQQAQQQAAQQQQQQQQAQQQAQMEGQVQVEMTHDGSQHIQQGAQVVSSDATSTVVVAAPQQTMLQPSGYDTKTILSPPTIAPMPSQGGSTLTTGPTQQITDWQGHQQRVQVIQQPMYQPVYAQGQGQQLIMPSNILHPGMNQPIQVIATGKPGQIFQPNQMQHMITAQGKPVQGLVQGQASFPGYATIPTSNTNQQTLVISQLGVLGQNILPAAPQQQGKPQEMQKMMTKSNGPNTEMKVASSQQNVSISNLVSSQPQGISTQAPTIIGAPQILSPLQYCNTQTQRTVNQGAPQAMQIAPWQTFPANFPQGLTWATPNLQGSALFAQGNQILIRGPQQDQGSMFIHSAAPPQQMQQHNQMQGQQMAKANQSMDMGANVQVKTAIPSKGLTAILPNSQQQLRPASSVSTQTGQTQTQLHQSNMQAKGSRGAVRTKTMYKGPNMAPKSDASNQTKGAGQPTGALLQPKMVTNEMAQANATEIHHQIVQNQMQQQIMFQTQPQQIQQKPPDRIDNRTGVQMMADGTMVRTSEAMKTMTGNMTIQTSAVPGMLTSVAMPTMQTVQGVPQPITMAAPAPVSQNSVKQEQHGEQKENGVAELPQPDFSWQGDQKMRASPAVTNDNLSNKDDKKSESDPNVKSEDKKDSDKKCDKDVTLKNTAMVKPQVLTHVIDGYVIQESHEPFAVNRGYNDTNKCMVVKDVLENGEPPNKKSCNDRNSPSKDKDLARCETCGKTDLRSKFKKSKRFCSTACAKRFNVGCSPRVGLFSGEDDEKKTLQGDTTESNDSNGESSLSPGDTPENQSESQEDDTPKVNPMKWTVTEVAEFIKNLPGCSEYVEEFMNQDIDGEALMLLKPDHLMSVMSMKLGPAVKIIAKIDTMRGDGNTAQKQ